MKKLIIYLIFLISSTAVLAQSGATRKLDKFTSISVSEGIDVMLVKGSSYKAVIKAENIDLDEILTEVSGSNLKIHLDGGSHNNIDVSIEVTYVALEKISANSAADIKSSSIIVADELSIEASSAADIKLNVKVKQLDVEVSSSADVVLSGTADSQKIHVSSAADYKAFELVSKNADVTSSSAADARINVTVSLTASASSGSNIKYKGSPDKVRESSSSGGDVEKY